MEIEQVKKKKKPLSSNKLSPPLLSLTLTEQEKLSTNIKRQHSLIPGPDKSETLDIIEEIGDTDANSRLLQSQGTEESRKGSYSDIAAADKCSDRAETTQKLKTNSDEDVKNSVNFPRVKGEETERIKSVCIPTDNLYLASTVSGSESFRDIKEAVERDYMASNIYPTIQLNEINASLVQNIESMPPPFYNEREKEHETLPSTSIQESLVVTSKMRNDVGRSRLMNVYPLHSSEKNQYGLLTENELLSFYQNNLYETVEDFVEEFLRHEEFPQHKLYDYLKRYKEACEQVVATEIDVAEWERLVKECAQASWTAENRVVKLEGRCGDQKYATGSATYVVATFHPEKANKLSHSLKCNASSHLDSLLSLQIQMCSLAMQIQWIIVGYNSAFMMEYRLNANSPPSLLPDNGDTTSRRNLRHALSDLFHFLRYPNLPSRFITNVSSWISELVAVLLKASTSEDQQYLLCQLLRLLSPISQWAAPLLQSYIDIDSTHDRLVIDNCIAMLSILLSSIRGRENFLRRIIDFENENNSWVIINDVGTEKSGSLVTINETDLISFLDQFSIEALFARAVQHFAISLSLNPVDQVLTLFAFELHLIKVFNDGLLVYGTAEYRQFCKQIGYALRQSVKCLADFFKVMKDTLSVVEVEMLQKEFDRIILHAVYYVVSKQSLGLWQFLVDLPYDTVSESCRMRCQILLRRKIALTVGELYEVSDANLHHLVKTAGNLLDKLPDLPGDDRIYMVSALTSIIAASNEDVEPFAVEIINVCFLDVSMRDHFYKVGSETIGILIDKHPHILQKILLLIDRNLDALDEYAVEVLCTAPLSKCRLSVDDVGVICGKWLINQEPNHPASRIARRVLGSMNWGTDAEGKLWLPPVVHAVCADTIMKGHMAQCKTTNGLILKSWNKIAKLASKVPNYEHRFDAFCWDILIRLKLPFEEKNVNFHSANDLVSFFLFIIQRSLLSIDEFLTSGLPLWSKLITSGCYAASVVILARLVSSFPDAINTLISESSFTQCFDKLLLCDQSPFVIQFTTGADKFPGPTIRFLSSAIMYHVTENFSQVHLNSWIQLLCCKRLTQWNIDKSTIYLLGVLVQVAFVRDPAKLLCIPEFLKINYVEFLQQWKEGAKSVLSWFTVDNSVPPLIDSAYFDISPWASFVLLLAEQQSHGAFYEALYQAMSKHPKNGLEQSVKKAASKSNINISIEQLHFHRWLQFACTNGIREHPIFPLILQNLAIHLYSRKTYQGKRVCYGEKYLNDSFSQPLFEKLQKKILPQMEHSSEKNVAVFYKAFAQWLSYPKLCNISFHAYDDFLLDHLLQFIFSNELHPWIEYVDMDRLRSKISDEKKLYIFACHLGSFGTKPPLTSTQNLAQLVTHLSGQNQAQPYPIMPVHRTLQREALFDLSTACDGHRSLTLFALQLTHVSEAARTFVAAKDYIETLDGEYVSEYPYLYRKSATELSVVLKCSNAFGSRCTHPTTSVVNVAASHYQIAVENKMKANRQKRSDELASIYSKLLDSTSLYCAYLENIACKMYDYRETVNDLPAIRAEQLQETGLKLFYHLTSSVTSLEMIFPAAAHSYGLILTKLGKAFIANNPHEQQNLMRVVFNNSHLAHLLTPYFTPHCVSSTELIDLYRSLSYAVRNPTTSSAALALLSQLDIENAGNKLPLQQFSQLMPAAFENLISLSDNSSPFYGVCAKHFIHSLFHRFPSNFVDGLKLALAACDTKSAPVYVFDEIIKQLNICEVTATDAKPRHSIDIKTAVSASKTIAVQFKKSRDELSTRLHSVWANYLPKVLLLSGFFLYKSAALSFDSQSPVAKLETELRLVFDSCVHLFGPLLEPFGAGFAPWNPADAESAAVVLEHFVSVMEQLHLLYDVYFPPGSENLTTLFWRYYVEKLAIRTRGGTHVHQMIESYFIRIPWHLFWPSLYDLASMDKILAEGAPEGAALLTQIVVRIPWVPLIQYQAQQPLDDHRAFYSLLFSILASCVSRSANYTICRASMPKLIGSLESFSWHLIVLNQLSAISSRIASIFPSTTLTEPDDVTNAFFELYRRVCFVGAISRSTPNVEICQKQSLYLRTQIALMLKNSSDWTGLGGFYEDQIKTVHSIVSLNEQPVKSQAYLSRELTSFWSELSDKKFLATFSSIMLNWLEKNASSPIVLLLMNTVINSLKPDQTSLGLQVIEKCIGAYFERVELCEWDVVLRWVVLPNRCRQSLFSLPSTENLTSFLPLCTNAFIVKKLISSISTQQETALLRDLMNFVTSLKPRYMTDEAAFLLLMAKLQHLLLRQYNYNVTRANQFLMRYLEWLGRVHSEDKSSSFFSVIGLAKKRPYSIKIRYICHLMELYITQQTVASNRPPRSASNLAVFNSRIQAFKDLCIEKHYAPFQETSQHVQPYFLEIQNYHISHVKELFANIVCSLYNEKYVQELLTEAGAPDQ